MVEIKIKHKNSYEPTYKVEIKAPTDPWIIAGILTELEGATVNILTKIQNALGCEDNRLAHQFALSILEHFAEDEEDEE